MNRFRRHIFRERRRLALFSGLVTLAAFMIFSDDIGRDFGIRYAAIAALGTGLGAGLIALGVLMVAPTWRHALETVGIATFLYGMMIIQLPGLSFHEGPHALAAFVGFLVSAAAIHMTLYGPWSDRLLKYGLHVERASCLTRLERETVWAAAMPVAGRPESFWDHTVERIDEDPDQPGALITFHRFDSGLMMEQQIRPIEVNPLRSFRYTYQTIGARPRGPQSLALLLEQRDPWLALHLRWERTNYPVRLALMHWIDDWGGRVVDLQLVRLEEAQTLSSPDAADLAPAT